VNYVTMLIPESRQMVVVTTVIAAVVLYFHLVCITAMFHSGSYSAHVNMCYELLN